MEARDKKWEKLETMEAWDKKLRKVFSRSAANSVRQLIRTGVYLLG